MPRIGRPYRARDAVGVDLAWIVVSHHSIVDPARHRHGARVHSHPYQSSHRHVVRGWRPSSRDGPHDHGGHGRSHGLVDESVVRSRDGIRAVSRSLAVLAAAAAAQLIVYMASGSVALLADLIHNFGDALTAIPLAIAFTMRSQLAERRAGLAVVRAIFTSACVAGLEAVRRLLSPTPPRHLLLLGIAGVIGYVGNLIAARIRTRAGERLDSPALIADGHHARADAYVSLAVVASAIVVALGLHPADPVIGLGITVVIMRITLDSWRTVRRDRH
jgi:Co/Zn/Cd efflux system component